MDARKLQALEQVCRDDRLDFIEKFKLNSRESIAALEWSVLSDSGDVVCHLLDRYEYDATVIKNALILACGEGHVSIAELLAPHGRVDHDIGSTLFAEMAGMKVERTEVVMWIMRRYGFSKDIIREEYSYIFRQVCELGWLGTAQRLASEFDFDKEDFEVSFSEALTKAYVNRKYDVARWLITEFDLGDEAQRLLAPLEELEFQRWLRERFFNEE